MRRRTIALAVAVAAWLALVARGLVRTRRAIARISNLRDETHSDDQGAVRSVQSAEVTLPEDELEKMWAPMNLERLARTYWRFLTRATLGFIRVKYTEGERYVCFLFRPFVLLSFQAPEYEMAGDRALVRWRIESGVLVSERGRGGNGYLEIEVRRLPEQKPGDARLYVEVEVANFYPAIASSIGRWVYENTQSRIHVIVTYGFLRSLAILDLAESRVGRLAERPPPAGDPQSNGAPALSPAGRP